MIEQAEICHVAARRAVIGAFVVSGLALTGLLAGPLTLTCADEAKPTELEQMVIDLIGDKDKDLRSAGLEQVRSEVKGASATRVFASQLPKLAPSAQVGLLGALADRGDAAARPALLELLSGSKQEEARAAALAALGKLGTNDDLPLLIRSLAASSEAERAGARAALGQMRGDAVSTELAAASKSAPSASKAALIEVLATRRAMDQLPAFIAASTDDDPVVRSAAMSALGQIGKPEQLAEMLPGVLKAEKGAERDAAEKNVALVCSRIDNEIKRGNELVAALKTVKPDQVDDLLSLVGRVGGTQLINFVGEIATGDDPARRKLGIDALGKWPNATVADKLMEIANKTTDPAERSQAFAGYVKICATRDKRTDAQRLARMQQAMKLAKTPQEQSLVINRSRTAYDVETLRFVLPYVDEAPLARVACETIVELAHHREIRDPNKAEFDKALDKVISASKDPVVIERANRYKRGETWTRP